MEMESTLSFGRVQAIGPDLKVSSCLTSLESEFVNKECCVNFLMADWLLERTFSSDISTKTLQ